MSVNQSQNKIIISSLSILTPQLNKTFYISIIINETTPLKTKIIEFQTSNQSMINQSFNLDPSITKIEKIEFQMFEKVNIFSNPLYRGVINGNNQVRDESNNNNFVCFLKNASGEDFAAVYYSFEFFGQDLLQQFSKNKNDYFKANQKTFFTFKEEDHLENYKKFLRNIDYLKIIVFEIEFVLKWKSPWKTLSFLLCFSLIILWFKFFFVFILPFVIIFYHLIFKGKIEVFCLDKNQKFNEMENSSIFYQILGGINAIIKKYEEFMKKILNGDSSLIEDFYKNLIKIMLVNIIIFYTGILSFISIRIIILFIMWGITLSYNPSFAAFFIFVKSLITTKLSFIFYNEKFIRLYYHCLHFIQILIPFHFFLMDQNSEALGKKGSGSIETKKSFDRKDNEYPNIKQESLSKSQTLPSNKQVIKYEIYENERWWMFVGWNKNMIMNEIPTWCKVDNQKEYCEKNMVFLPNNDQFKWSGEWKIEKNPHSDNLGWEYSSDFHSQFNQDSYGKYVRRRKWVRYASQV